MQSKALAIHDFLEQSRNGVILDVRSPKEYVRGHIPGAISFPLFTDDERHKIGLTYKRDGRDKAVYVGLQVVGPKLSRFVDEALKVAPEKQVCLYCWRGGMRSNSMALLLSTAGFQVSVLKNGYKAYRQYALSRFEQPLKLVNLGGYTGTGKTDLLHKLSSLGQQILDLEDIARHKGSAFGNLEKNTQPSTEHFENLLALALSNLKTDAIIYTEDESITIGKVRLPLAFFRQLQRAPLIFLGVSDANRVARLSVAYGNADVHEVAAAFNRLKKRLGGKALAEAIEAVENNDVEQAAAIALRYYDKTYYRSLENRTFTRFKKLDANRDIEDVANDIIALSTQFYAS